MDKKETIEMPLLNENHRHNLVRALCVVYQKIQKIEHRGLIQVRSVLIYDSRREIIRTDVDVSFIKAVKGGAYGAYRELQTAGASDLAKQALEIARNANI